VTDVSGRGRFRVAARARGAAAQRDGDHSRPGQGSADGPAPGFVLVSAGQVTLGSPPHEHRRQEDYVGVNAEDQRVVTITRPFLLAGAKVTQGEWEEVMGSRPWYFRACGRDCPVERVN